MKPAHFLFFCIPFFLTACSGPSVHDEAKSSSTEKTLVAHEPYAKKENSGTPENSSAYTAERKVVKEGEIAFSTGDIDGTERMIKDSAAAMNGYIALENI